MQVAGAGEPVGEDVPLAVLVAVPLGVPELVLVGVTEGLEPRLGVAVDEGVTVRDGVTVSEGVALHEHVGTSLTLPAGQAAGHPQAAHAALEMAPSEEL